MNVYFYGCVTLDGYLADKRHGLDWLHQTGSAEETGYECFYRNMDVTLMGRRTFEEIVGLEDAASIYPTTENYVFTHRERLPQPGFIPVRICTFLPLSAPKVTSCFLYPSSSSCRYTK